MIATCGTLWPKGICPKCKNFSMHEILIPNEDMVTFCLICEPEKIKESLKDNDEQKTDL